MGIHSCVDVYVLFQFEAMHFLLLEAGKVLKECILLMLGDENRKTCLIKCAIGNYNISFSLPLYVPFA